MFDELDPPTPFEPGRAFRIAVVARGIRLRRRRRVIVSALCTSTVLVLVAAAGLVQANGRLNDVDRVEIAQLPPSEGEGMPFNMLLVGVDGPRPEVDGLRSDTIAVVRVWPDAGKLAVLSLPRDLHVPISDGSGAEARINTALTHGAGVLVDTIEDSLGIPLDRYVQVDFEGFQRIVDAVGGLDVRFPEPVRDRSTGLSIPTAGCVRLDGNQALALARARRLQVFGDGGWRIDVTGDFGRVARQQLVGLAILDAARSAGRNPIEIARRLDVVLDELTIDSGWKRRELLSLADQLRTLEPTDVIMYGLPVREDVLGGARVLRLDDGVQAVIARFHDGAEPTSDGGGVPRSPITGDPLPAPFVPQLCGGN